MDSYSSCDGYLTSHRFANSGKDVDLTDRDFSLRNGHRDIAHLLLLGFGSSLEARNMDQRKLESGQ
jgi:hypothetical protein